MAVRTPLKLASGNNLQQMSTAEITKIKDRVRWLWAENPSVTLSRVASGGNLGSLSQSYVRSGEARKSTGNQDTVDDGAAEYVSEADTPEPEVITTSFAHISETRANTSATHFVGFDTSVGYPLYYTSGGDLQAMSETDFYDTFIYPAIDTLTSGTGQPGMYAVFNTTSKTGYTRQSASVVYYDEVSQLNLFDSTGIGDSGTVQDPATSISNQYWLYRYNNIAEPVIEIPVKATADGDIQLYVASTFDDILENAVRHAASEVTGSKITYTYASGGGAVNLGNGMIDTRRQGDGRYVQQFVGADDYRSQEFPSGAPTAVTTHYLRVKQT